MKNKLEYRLYTLNLYQLTQIQVGVQSLHSCIEYSLKYGKNEDYKKWSSKDKTVILLNGGTSKMLEDSYKSLVDNKIKVAKFHEPDLYNVMTSISLLVSEQVWNKTKYPDFVFKYNNVFEKIGLSTNDMDEYNDKYEQWVKFIGGEQNVFLRMFLSQFKLA